MDTKSKSRHSLGIIIIMIVVLLTSAATVGLYPYLVERAFEYKERYEAQRKDNYINNVSNDLALQMMNSCYQAWREQVQEEEGRLLTPSQVFLPELENKLREAQKEQDTLQDANGDEAAVVERDSQYDAGFYASLMETMDSAGDEWRGYSQIYTGRLKYRMMDENGNLLRSNVSNPDLEFGGTKGDEMLINIHFTSSGALKVDSMDQVGDQDRMRQALAQYEFYDPIANRLGADYRYSGVEFSGPKNVKFEFKCSPTEFSGNRIREADPMLGPYDLNYDGSLYMVEIAMCGVLFMLAMVLPAFKSLQIGRSALCRVNFEPVIMLGTLWLVMLGDGSLPGALIALTHNGNLQRELERTHMAVPAASVLVLVINILFWIVVYGMFYWGITCLRAVFSLGLWRYIKERTWIGRFCCFVKRWVCRCLNPFNETDWHSNSSKAIGKAVIANFIILTLISCLWFFGIVALVIYSLVLFFLIRRYWDEMEGKYNRLLEMINQMAKGDLDVDVPEDLGLFNPLKEQLTRVRQGFKKAVEQEVKSERTKTELITNVSHDLKTPLTAIITYVNLLKQPGITEEERTSYIQVLDQKSMRLKVLIEDLFEVSKATSGAVTMNRGPVDILSLIKQVRLELSDRMEASGVEFRWALPEEKIILYLDSQRTYRIFENLLVNITKYAMAGTRAYISLDEDESGTVTIILRNISAKELNVSPEELTERFVRGDASRNTEGSGLGLAIARSFTELQDGTMEVSVEGDLFRVLIRFKRMEEKPDGAERGNDGNDGNNGNDGGDWNGGGDGIDGSGSDEIERGARGFRGGLRGIVRRKAGETTGKMSREFSKASKRRAAHERTKAREEELKRETARAKEAAKQREQAQTKDPEPEAEWDFGQDEAWSAVLDDGKEQDRETP